VKKAGGAYDPLNGITNIGTGSKENKGSTVCGGGVVSITELATSSTTRTPVANIIMIFIRLITLGPSHEPQP